MMVTVTDDHCIFILCDAFGHVIMFTLLNLLSILGENYVPNHYSFASERTVGKILIKPMQLYE